MPNKYGFFGEVPPNVSLENNIRLALEYKQTHPSIYDRIIWFNEMVRNNKDRHLPLNNSFDYKQIHPKYAQFGNFNYGVVGTALGLSASILKWGAGAAQIVSNTKNPKLLAMAQAVFYDNYGDNPEDQVQIIKGIAYAQKLGLAPHENKSISPNFYTRIEEMPEHVTNINLYLKKIWDVIPANDVYYDQNHKFNHKKLMDLNSPENQQEYQSVLMKIINFLPEVADLSSLDQLAIVNQIFSEKGKNIEYQATQEMLTLNQEQAHHTPNQFGFSQAALEQADKMMQERLAQNQNQSRSLG